MAAEREWYDADDVEPIRAITECPTCPACGCATVLNVDRGVVSCPACAMGDTTGVH